MPDDDSRAWVIAPPATGEVSFSLELGEGAELTREQEEALSEFISCLEHREAEVAGYVCTPLSGCTRLRCGTVSCGVLICDTLTKRVAPSGGMTIVGTFGAA
jgi:hypothetical protein